MHSEADQPPLHHSPQRHSPQRHSPVVVEEVQVIRVDNNEAPSMIIVDPSRPFNTICSRCQCQGTTKVIRTTSGM